MRKPLIIGILLGILLAILGIMFWHEPEDLCDPSNEGTDYWHEVCMNEGEIDLGVQDEADTLTSSGRVEL